MDGAKERWSKERRSDGENNQRSDGENKQRSDRKTKRISDGGTERQSDSNKKIFCDYYTVGVKSKTVATLCWDLLMPLLSTFWRSINRKARVVVSLGMRLMARSTDDDETTLYNFGDFGRFIRMRRK